MASDPSSRWSELDGLRGVAIILVVGIHALAYSHLDSGVYSTLWFLVSAVAVPIFYLVDGLLLGLRSDRYPGYSTLMQRSARRLLWPWLLFGLTYMVVRALFEAGGFADERVLVDAGPSEWLGAFVHSRVAMQLYFLPSLFLLRGLSPLLRQVARLSEWAPWGLFLAITLLLRAGGALDAYADAFGQDGYDIIVHTLWGLQFYLLGFAATGMVVRLRDRRWALVGLIGLALATLLGTLSRGGAIPTYAYLILIVAPFVGGPLKIRAFEALGRQSMGIYLIHTPVLMSLLMRIVASFDPGIFVHYVVLTVADLAIAYGLTIAIGHIPGARAFLFGEPRKSRAAK